MKFLKALGVFLSGHKMRESTMTALDRFFEKRTEPRYRRKAAEAGFSEAFERHLIEWRYQGAHHASLLAYRVAEHDHNEA